MSSLTVISRIVPLSTPPESYPEFFTNFKVDQPDSIQSKLFTDEHTNQTYRIETIYCRGETSFNCEKDPNFVPLTPGSELAYALDADCQKDVDGFCFSVPLCITQTNPAVDVDSNNQCVKNKKENEKKANVKTLLKKNALKKLSNVSVPSNKQQKNTKKESLISKEAKKFGNSPSSQSLKHINQKSVNSDLKVLTHSISGSSASIKTSHSKNVDPSSKVQPYSKSSSSESVESLKAKITSKIQPYAKFSNPGNVEALKSKSISKALPHSKSSSPGNVESLKSKNTSKVLPHSKSSSLGNVELLKSKSTSKVLPHSKSSSPGNVESLKSSTSKVQPYSKSSSSLNMVSLNSKCTSKISPKSSSSVSAALPKIVSENNLHSVSATSKNLPRNEKNKIILNLNAKNMDSHLKTHSASITPRGAEHSKEKHLSVSAISRPVSMKGLDSSLIIQPASVSARSRQKLNQKDVDSSLIVQPVSVSANSRPSNMKSVYSSLVVQPTSVSSTSRQLHIKGVNSSLIVQPPALTSASSQSLNMKNVDSSIVQPVPVSAGIKQLNMKCLDYSVVALPVTLSATSRDVHISMPTLPTSS